YADASRVLTLAARLGGNTAEGLFEVATVTFAEGDFRAAQRACRALAKAHEGHPLVHVCNAHAFLVRNRSARAFEELEGVLEKDPNHVEALLALGEAHRKRASISDAEEAYQKAASLDPGNPEPHLGLGRLYLMARRTKDGIASLRRALSLDAESPEVLFEIGRALADTDEGRAFLTRAAEAQPGSAEAQLALGQVLLDRGDPKGAEVAFRAAIKANKGLADARIGLAEALLGQDDLAGAERELEGALAMVENAPRAVLLRARVYSKTDRVEEAFKEFQRAASLDPRNPEPLNEAAEQALALGRDVLGAAFLDRLLSRHPNNARGLALYGDVMKSRSKPDEARSYYQRALQGDGSLDRMAVQKKLNAL
ncbi:MAG: tetratricopeptide repeat protein, partial [Myxococcales bacterium]|nr:tetratricopeptide repeat protein [Myxococcales bacterium]